MLYGALVSMLWGGKGRQGECPGFFCLDFTLASFGSTLGALVKREPFY